MADLEQQHPMLFNKFIELMNQDQAKDLVRGINMCVPRLHAWQQPFQYMAMV